MSSDAPVATESVASPSAVAETFSADYVAKLKAELEAKNQSEAALKAKFAAHENRQREQLKMMQPAVQEWIKEGVEAESFIRLHVVQAVGNERGNYEMRIEAQHVDGEYEAPGAGGCAGEAGKNQ